MRRILTTSLFGVLMSVCSARADVIYNADLVSDTCIAKDTNYDLPLSGLQDLSFVAVYSTAAPAQKTFTDGTKSSATITISSNTALSARAAQVTVVVASFSALGSSSLTLNGVRFFEGPGGQWTKVATATGTAVALSAAIDAHADFTSVVTSTVITVSAAINGEFGNGYTCTSSTIGMTCSGATFEFGRDNAVLAVNGVVFRAGTGFTVASTSTGTAKSLSDAIMANATLAALFSSTWSAAAVITATSTAVGTGAHTLFTSTPSALRLNGSATAGTAAFTHGSTSKVDTDTELITILGHNYGTGLAVLYSTTTTPALTGLVGGTTYFVIENDYDRIKLATSKANAAAGTAINITAQAGALTYTLTPQVISGTPNIKWQGSNNNSTFIDLPFANVDILSTDSFFWDLGTLPYRYLRLKYTSPTTGCTSVTVSGTGSQ